MKQLAFPEWMKDLWNSLHEYLHTTAHKVLKLKCSVNQQQHNKWLSQEVSNHLTTNSKHGHQEKQLSPSFIFVDKTHEDRILSTQYTIAGHKERGKWQYSKYLR